jgi:ABC-type dipeptide transport system, periplasmic component
MIKIKAEALLEEAGWKKGQDGFRYNGSNEKLSIKWSTYEGNKFVETLIPTVVNSWKEIGVEVTVERMPFYKLVEKVYDNREFEMYNMSWVLTEDPNPYAIFSMKQDRAGGYNAVGWRNEDSERLINEALQMSDQGKRKEIYNAWGKLANEELPYLYLNQNKELLAVNMRVKGVDVSPYRSWTENINAVSLEYEEEQQ